MNKVTPVILDTDIGGDIDDTWALALLLRSPELKLLAITTVTGDTAYRAKICAKMIQTARQEAVPIGMGPQQKMSQQGYPQNEWVGQFDIGIYNAPVTGDAADLMIRTIRNSSVPVTVIGIGPFSNTAEALRRAPDIASNANFIGLGGSIYKKYFGMDGHCSEYNIKCDVPAARMVFTASWQSIRFSPLDTCGNIILRGVRYRSLFESRDPLAEAVIENYRIWRKFRLPIFPNDPVCNPATESSLIADTAAIALAAVPGITGEAILPLIVSDQGETLVNQEDGHPVRVALSWKNVESFYDFVTERLLNNLG